VRLAFRETPLQLKSSLLETSVAQAAESIGRDISARFSGGYLGATPSIPHSSLILRESLISLILKVLKRIPTRNQPGAS